MLLSEILPIAEFVARRPQLERQLIGVRGARRLAVGPNLTLLFENHLTTWWQVQEMCRVEGITAPEGVQHELDTYNRLGGEAGELGATLLVEYPDEVERDVMLARLLGLDRHLRLEVGGHVVVPRFDDEQWNDRRISSVQFLWLPFAEAARQAFFDLSQPAVVVVDHPAYAARVDIPLPVRGALCEDLAG